MCNSGVEQQEEDEESEYSYEYCTDSEYEYEEESKAEVSECIKIVVPPPPLTSPPPPPPSVIQQNICEDKHKVEDDADEEEAEVEVNDEEFKKHREQLEKFKPKLPDYVTTPEPCAFSDDPSRWIAWMEEEVNKEKERRFRELQAAQEEEERKEKEIREEEEKIERKKREEEERLIREEEEQKRREEEEEERLKRERQLEEERLSREMKEAEEELEKAAREEEKRLKELREKEILDASLAASAVISNLKKENADAGEAEVDEDESEWEYESEEEKVEEEGREGDKNTDLAEKAHSGENLIDSSGNELAKGISEGGESEDANDNVAVKDGDGEERGDINKDNGEDVVESAEQNRFVAKAATHGQKSAVRENPTDNPKLDGSLDAETQRKLDFVRRKKAEARSQTESSEGLQQLGKRRDDPIDCLDEATRSKLEFIRQKKASAPACPSNGTDAADGRPNGLPRQQSCPEKRSRPSSIVSGGSESLDDMLARIKTLRAERKQILQDMSAIKNAFDGPSVKEESGDDGIDSAGDSTPILEQGAPFQQGQQGPSAASLSRQGRRSIDSGIGSKSMSSNADGSPTAELESIHEGSESHGGRKKIAREERGEVVGEGETFFCFICGENLGRLSKGAVMHMGLDDGEPVCPDALYLTDESKDKIKNIASTKMFTHEAKYKLLETVDLEIYDIDYGIPAEDVMDKVDAFLMDVEKQKQLDKEKFDAMRSGAIDEILMEEFKDILDPGSSSLEDMETDDAPVTPRPKFQFSAATQALLDGKKAPPPPPRSSSNQTVATPSPPSTPPHNSETSSSSAPPPPPPPPSTSEEAPSITSSIPAPPPALSGVLNSIKSGQIPVLKHAETHDSSELGVGTVIHKHIAPRAFTKDMRCLVKDIRGDEHKKRLKKVKTVDKSRPFIPDDMEIYFYGGNNSDKKAPPPPLSKQPVNSSKKRGSVKEGG